MKKIILLLIFIGSFLNNVMAQLGINKDDALEISNINGSVSNNMMRKIWLYRNKDGNDWFSASLHDGIAVDVSFLQPQVNTRTWWQRDPRNEIQSWGTRNLTFMTLKGGKLGVGTTDPKTPLDIQSLQSGWIMSSRATAVAAGEINGLKFYSGAPDEDKWAGVASVSENLTSTKTGLSLYSGMAERVRISGDGKVGIGTTDPKVQLDIQSSQNGWMMSSRVIAGALGEINGLKFYSGYPGEDKWAGIASVAESLYSNKTGLSLYSGMAERIRISADGKVGIGTSNPLTGLQLGNIGSEITAKQITIPGVYNFERVKIGQIGNGNSELEFINHSGINTSYGMKLTTNVDNGGYGLQFKYAGSESSYESLKYKTGMILGITGNVGIGTVSPKAVLDVAKYVSSGELGTVLSRMPEGDQEGMGTYLGVKGYETQFSNYNGKTFALEHGFYGLVNSSISFYRGGSKTGGFMTFSTNENTEQMRIDGAGNVGIGIINPTEKLTVNGKIKANEIRVNGAGAPDYVFEDGYKVETLQALESYIKTNKHLPEVPSAKEFERDGMAIGEMNKLLLKKIEELTLHLIEKDKQYNGLLGDVKKQEERIRLLEKRLGKL
jgi:hypothetical protein